MIAASDLDAWGELWRALGAPQADPVAYAALVERHREPRRHYHSLQHLDECLRHFDAVRAEAEHPAEVELALWFHDAIYEPFRRDNEERSAQWAAEVARAAGLAADVVARVQALIMATRHEPDAPPRTPDEMLVVDIDLAILGADVRRFDEYERQVRAEYSGIPGVLFRPKRRAVLEGFLARERIYRTPHFHDRFEAKARENLRRSIAKLRG